MQFRRIKFHNYRCFIDDEIDFSLPRGMPRERNIILFSAENGGGKTQLMYAFRFVLFGYRDEDLFGRMQGQQAVPWALNNNIHEALENGAVGRSASASVELAFGFCGKTYTLLRTRKYRRNVSGVQCVGDDVRLNVQSAMGDTELATSEPSQIRSHIVRIIPEKTLYALLCDGERVRQLTASGSEANSAIRAIIQRMTENELLDMSDAALTTALRTVRRQIRRTSPASDDLVSEAIIERTERRLKELEEQIVTGEEQITNAKMEISRISEDLKQISAVRELEQQRCMHQERRTELEAELVVANAKLIESLNDKTYWGIADGLSDDVQNLLENAELRFPGLEADVVATILKGDNCICGRCIDGQVRKYLENLRIHLPPINIDAELSSVLHQYGNDEFRQSRRKEIRERIHRIGELQQKISTENDTIGSLTREIESSTNENATVLEEQYSKCIDTITKYSQSLASYRIEQSEALREVQNMRKQYLDDISRRERGGVLQQKLNLIQGASLGIEYIKTYRMRMALLEINKKLSAAFEHLRSRSDAQRQVYVTMYSDTIELVVYMKEATDRDFNKMVRDDMDNEERLRCRERAILMHEEGNSMGQLKIVSLAFMKAILDYVKEVARTDRNLEDAMYPIVVDAPFSDIERENYENAVEYLHEFSDQVVLLLADENPPEGLKPYIAKTFTVRRVNDNQHMSNYSVISEVR